MVPQRFYTHNQRGSGDRHVYAQRTRFIPNSMLNHFDNVSWPRAKAAGETRSAAARDTVDIRARMRSMWG